MNTTKYRSYNPRNAKNVDKYRTPEPYNIDYATMDLRYLDRTVRESRKSLTDPQKFDPGPHDAGLVLATYTHYRSKICV